MKAKLFLAISSIVIASGCGKSVFEDYECTCTTNFGIAGEDTTFTAEYLQVRSDDAQTICDSTLLEYQADDPAASCALALIVN